MLLLGGGADPPPSAEATLAALQARYDEVRDLRAGFTQYSFTAALGREEVSRGAVKVQRPGKMRWSYDPPDSRVIILDGETIRIYDPQESQLQIAPLRPETLSPTALSLLLGEGRLADQFEAEGVEGDRPELGLRLVPRGDPGFESLVLWLDAQTHELRESVLVDLFGNRTRLALRDVLHNGGVPEVEFDLDVPEGTEVIDLR